jgi:hypothetical protein
MGLELICKLVAWVRELPEKEQCMARTKPWEARDMTGKGEVV